MEYVAAEILGKNMQDSADVQLDTICGVMNTQSLMGVQHTQLLIAINNIKLYYIQCKDFSANIAM